MRFGRSATEAFSNPNGIAVDEATGDVYVADIGTDTVYKFDANGNSVDFAALGSNALTGAATEAKSFSFPSVYGSPAAIAVDNACVQHAPALTGKACEEFDPSAGDLYVMDSGHGVIDKFSPEGRYLSQIGATSEANRSAWAPTEMARCTSTWHSGHLLQIDEFDDAAVNHRIASQVLESEFWVITPLAFPANPRPTASPSPPRAMTTRCTTVVLVYGQVRAELSRSAAWTAAKRATSRWPSTPRPATSTQTISPPWPNGTPVR